jgi:hypothetical protein
MLSHQQGENGARLFATTGPLQQWRLNERWLFDVGFDHVNTVSQSNDPTESIPPVFNPGAPASSGSFNEDFSAFFYRGRISLRELGHLFAGGNALRRAGGQVELASWGGSPVGWRQSDICEPFVAQ